MTVSSNTIHTEGITPILRIEDLAASIDYFTNVLDFNLSFHQPRKIASVSRDRCSIFLVEGDQGNPGSWLWI